MTAPPDGWAGSAALYDAMAPDYNSIFAQPSYRRAYDLLAGEFIARLLPEGQGTIVDAGCGTGRWAAHWLGLGHRVIGIEQSPRMVAALRHRRLGERFRLVEASMDQAEIDPGSADLVVAMGSMQYTADPGSVLRRFADWVRPGGHVCVYTDSLTALVLELMRLGKTEEALKRLETRRGIFRQGDRTAELHLFDRAALERLFADAGLAEITCRGLLVTASAWDKARATEAALADEDAFLALERRLMAAPAMADAGKHIIVSGRRPLVG